MIFLYIIYFYISFISLNKTVWRRSSISANIQFIYIYYIYIAYVQKAGKEVNTFFFFPPPQGQLDLLIDPFRCTEDKMSNFQYLVFVT